MALQTADAIPVRYGPSSQWRRVSYEELEDNLPKGINQIKCIKLQKKLKNIILIAFLRFMLRPPK